MINSLILSFLEMKDIWTILLNGLGEILRLVLSSIDLKLMERLCPYAPSFIQSKIIFCCSSVKGAASLGILQQIGSLGTITGTGNNTL